MPVTVSPESGSISVPETGKVPTFVILTGAPKKVAELNCISGGKISWTVGPKPVSSPALSNVIVKSKVSFTSCEDGAFIVKVGSGPNWKLSCP